MFTHQQCISKGAVQPNSCCSIWMMSSCSNCREVAVKYIFKVYQQGSIASCPNSSASVKWNGPGHYVIMKCLQLAVPLLMRSKAKLSRTFVAVFLALLSTFVGAVTMTGTDCTVRLSFHKCQQPTLSLVCTIGNSICGMLPHWHWCVVTK